MPRIQVYLREKLSIELKEIAAERAEPGEKPNESKTASELLEIGIRVEKYRKENSGNDIFDQALYNKDMLEMMSKVNFTVQKMIGMLFYLQEIQGKPSFEFKNMVNEIINDTQSMVDKYFVTEKEN